MTVQIIAIGAAIAYALSFILSKRGFRNSTPLTATLPLWVVLGSKLLLNDVGKDHYAHSHRRHARRPWHHRNCLRKSLV